MDSTDAVVADDAAPAASDSDSAVDAVEEVERPHAPQPTHAQAKRRVKAARALLKLLQSIVDSAQDAGTLDGAAESDVSGVMKRVRAYAAAHAKLWKEQDPQRFSHASCRTFRLLTAPALSLLVNHPHLLDIGSSAGSEQRERFDRTTQVCRSQFE